MTTSKIDRPLDIYGVPLSVHTRKVIAAARLKGFAYRVHPVAPVVPTTLPPHWRDLSPTGLIPAIDHRGYRLADSTAIVLYLERLRPEPALVPRDPERMGEALALDAWAGTALFRRIVHPLFHNQVVRPKIRKEAAEPAAIEEALGQAVPEAFAHLEGLRPDGFLVDGTLSIADLAVVSNLMTFHYLGHRIDAQRYPRLEAYFRRQLAAPAIAALLEAEKPAVDQMGLDGRILEPV
jgi:glutathione S-transferase